MKAKTLIIFMALALFCGIGFSSCTKSNDDLLKELSEIGTDLGKAIKDGDIKKIESLTKKGEEIENELNKRDLTSEQKDKLEDIKLEIAANALNSTSSAFENALESVFGDDSE